MSEKNTKRDFRSEARASGAQRRAMEQQSPQGKSSGATTITGQKPAFLNKNKGEPSPTEEKVKETADAPSPAPGSDNKTTDRAPERTPQPEATKPSKNQNSEGSMQGKDGKKLSRLGSTELYFEHRQLPVDEIVSWSFKDRTRSELDDDESFVDLVSSVRALGVLQDIVVWARKDDSGKVTFQEIFGFKRLTASRIAGHTHIPAKVLHNLTEKDAAVIMAGENAGRSNPSAWSLSLNNLAYIEQTNIAKNATALASILGEKPETVRNRIRVAKNMPEAVKDALVLHRIGIEALLAFATLFGPKEKHAENQEYIDLVVHNAERFNESPKQAKSILQSLLRKHKQEQNPEQVPEPNGLDFNGEKAFTWNLTAKGGKITIHKSIRHLITENDLEKALKSIIRSKKA
jgi:ParB/RepB/Spo0J family partition protein